MAKNSDTIKLPRSIWALGFVSLFMDVSSEIIHGLLPVFLVSVLGASMMSIGLLEGLAEATVLILKVISGPLSDWLQRRKPLVLIGYSMGVLSKPLFALAPTIAVVYGARLFDRMGKGIRGAPRDALVADLAPKELRGRAFGLRQSLDTVGAFLGPLLAIALMYLFNNNYRIVFGLATIPGLICLGILVFGVKEKEKNKEDSVNQRIHLNDLKKFSIPFWFVVGVGVLFQLARFSEAFLILRVKDFGLDLSLVPLVLIVMNIVYSLSAYPFGFMSDFVQREWFLIGGLIVLCLSDFILGMATSLPISFLGIVLWGLHLGLTQGVLTTLVADTCDSGLRGTGYGIFNLFSAVTLLFASILAGYLWDHLGAEYTFVVGGGFSLASLILLLISIPLWRKPSFEEAKS